MTYDSASSHLFLVSISKGHIDTLAPTVNELVELEKRVQTSFLALKNSRNLIKTP